jgi:hypothetical protein
MTRRIAHSSKDANHDEIVETFRALGCSVVETNLPPVAGFPDSLVGLLKKTHLVEIKSLDTAYGRRGLNANQCAFAQEWRGSPVHTVTTRDEAIALVQNWRRAA